MPPSGKPLSRTARAGSRPRSAVCAGSAHAGHSSPRTWRDAPPTSKHLLGFATTCWAGVREPQGERSPSHDTRIRSSELTGHQLHSKKKLSDRLAHRGLQQRPACPASNSERASSFPAAAFSRVTGGDRGSLVGFTLSHSPE